MNFKKVSVKDKNVTPNITLKNFDGGFACYVNAISPDGFNADESIIITPDVRDTGDYVAIENHIKFWVRPTWGKSLSELPEKVQMLLIKEGEEYVCYLPVCDSVFKTLIRGCEGGFEFFSYSNSAAVTECRDQLAFVSVRGANPIKVADDAAKKAAELLGGTLKMRYEKEMPDVFNLLGWCSWDAFHVYVDHDGLVKKAREFREKGVPVRFAIIDDMWADVPRFELIPENATRKEMVAVMHSSPIRSFEGDKKRFPEGMKGAIADIKKEGVDHVGIWFPTTGYWAGFAPDGEIAEKHKDNLITVKHATFIGGENLAVAPISGKADAVYDDLLSRVRSWGADFVKIDNQAYHDQYRNISPIGKTSRVIQHAIDSNADKYFGGALINCMGMTSECMFNRTSAVSRCSEDFKPESREWFAKNILQCSYNGLLQGRYYVNDWDMWWTDDEQATKNSLCRAISGGPIYISDELGRTRAEIIKPLCLSDGRILRPDESATPTVDCIIQNPTETDKIFKIRNRFGNNGVCAAFNVSAENTKVTGEISPATMNMPEGDYIYYEFFTRSIGFIKKGETIAVTLENNDDFRLYSLIPYSGAKVTPLGRVDLFMGIGAVDGFSDNECTVKEGGELGFVILDENENISLHIENYPNEKNLKIAYKDLAI